MKKILRRALRLLLVLLLTASGLMAAVIAFLFLWPSVGKLPGRQMRSELEGSSPWYTDGAFRNPATFRTITGKGWPPSERRIPDSLLPAVSPEFLTDPSGEDLAFTWLGHSSFLLQMGEVNILVDPVFSDRCSPVGFAGPKRFSEKPGTADELPDIDVLFVSHDHYDHLDYRTILQLKDRVGAFIVPLGVDCILEGWGVPPEKIHALDWWESVEMGGTVFTLTPSQHFTGRNPLRRNAVFWGGVYIDNGFHSVYYTGDGGYSDSFREVGERLGPPEVMFAECGQYDPAWEMMHMFPEQTVQAAADVGARWMIPVHWAAFCICNHAWDDPIIRVTSAAEAAGISLATPEIGRTVRLKDISSCSVRWWEGLD